MGLFSFILCVIYTIAGIAAFVTFLILQYYAAAVYAFVTGVVSAITAHLLWLHIKNRVNLWYDVSEMKQIFWFAFVVFLIGCSTLTYHISTMVLLQKAILKLTVASIWSFITLKHGGILMYYSYKYKFEVSENRPLLTPQQQQQG